MMYSSEDDERRIIHSQDSREYIDTRRSRAGHGQLVVVSSNAAAAAANTDTTTTTTHSNVSIPSTTTAIASSASLWTDLAIHAAAACNQAIVEHCGLCTIYSDKQLDFEGQESYLYQQQQQQQQQQHDNLFDEDCVVDSMSSRW